MNEHGFYHSSSSSGGVGAPTKLIHFIWLQGRAHMAEHDPALERYVQSWDVYFPQWPKVFWDETEIKGLLGEKYPQAMEIYDKLPSFAAKADLARYAILYTFGGMYVDTDMECLENFECLFRPGMDFYVTLNDRQLFLEATFGARINNAWMYAVQPGFPALLDLVNSISRKGHKPSNSMRWIMTVTGPRAFAAALKPYDDRVGKIAFMLLEPVTPTFRHLDADGKGALRAFPYAYAAHHSRMSWTTPLTRFTHSCFGALQALSGLLAIVFVVLCIILAITTTMLAARKCHSAGTGGCAGGHCPQKKL